MNYNPKTITEMVFERLPPELLTTHIIPFLDIKSKFNFGLICMKYFRFIEKDLIEFRKDNFQSVIRPSLFSLKNTSSAISLVGSIKLDDEIIRQYNRYHVIKRIADYITFSDTIIAYFDVYSHMPIDIDCPIFINYFDRDINGKVIIEVKTAKVAKIIFINNSELIGDDLFKYQHTNFEFNEYYFNKEYTIILNNRQLTWKDIILGLFMVKRSKSDLNIERYSRIDDIKYDNEVLYIYPKFGYHD